MQGTVSGTSAGAGVGAAPAQPTTGHAGAEHRTAGHSGTGPAGTERGTRARIARLILEHGPASAAGLSGRLGLTPAAVRRHLDNLLADGMIEAREARCYGSRGRGRPARLFAITDAGRSAFEHAYDDLATSALRFLAERAGPGAVAEFARRQVADLEEQVPPGGRRRSGRASRAGPGRGAVGGWLRRLGEWRAAQRPAASSSASTTARSPTWPRSSRNSARLRPRRSAACSAPRCSAWPRSPAATGSAPRTSPRHRSCTPLHHASLQPAATQHSPEASPHDDHRAPRA